jgi:hypothetical protein
MQKTEYATKVLSMLLPHKPNVTTIYMVNYEDKLSSDIKNRMVHLKGENNNYQEEGVLFMSSHPFCDDMECQGRIIVQLDILKIEYEIVQLRKED